MGQSKLHTADTCTCCHQPWPTGQYRYTPIQLDIQTRSCEAKNRLDTALRDIKHLLIAAECVIDDSTLVKLTEEVRKEVLATLVEQGQALYTEAEEAQGDLWSEL